MRQGALYSIVCMEYKESGGDSVYFGETGRTLYDRGFEHLEGHRRKYKESILVEHKAEVPKGEPPETGEGGPHDQQEQPQGGPQHKG